MIIGLVGKPSCGKSTFFNASTLAGAEMASYPFTTIKANHAVGFVKVDCVDSFFSKQCNPRFGYCQNHKRFIPVDMMDIAGLVPGAHEGLGMGNQFLEDIRQANVCIHVVDASGSTNEKGELVGAFKHDPVKDIAFLEEELDYWYFGVLDRGWDRMARLMVQEKSPVDRIIAKQMSAFGVTEDMTKDLLEKMKLKEKKPTDWTKEELFTVAQKLRHATKPVLIAANKIDVPGCEENIERLKKAYPTYTIIPCSAESEFALRQAAKAGIIEYIPGEKDFKILDESKINENQKKALLFIKQNILERYGTTGVQQVLNAAVFDFLKYVAIYPGGVGKLVDSEGRTLPDCFLMPPGTTALDFAYKLHSDFGKHFIRAVNVKTKMAIGRDIPLNNGDVVEIFSGK
ncbi:MAG TPA: redox-regulated ATPase YchF [Candidatus Nanoarchaeia archaeon]|nr:redox-regulated ATPase YchF [Candidatus Nanoarchaeia archaeon]